jgi:5-methyltetrahydrofolate--homocysteine methyltransferase
MDDMIQIVKLLRPETQLPIIAQANAGMPETENGVIIYKESPQERYNSVKEILSHGINIVGGCCGTNPDHIKSTAKAVHEFNG